ncbi:alcohol dehydrogenase [Candidatus Acidianus copahuensis]|uniref:Alcohol dehydrogenase n=1 Tax=Candidatus Acidianus copahuensis TaxID=1160895 RepID=A0A031LNB1_9CREN|nr:alcohol dehydrogenase [Candidatus Acidianus copahuensis]
MFEYPRTKVIYGEKSLYWMSSLKGRKIVIVTTKSLMQGKLVKKVVDLVNGDLIQGPPQHTPESSVEKLKQEISTYDVVISLGGGSIIDGVKLTFPKFHIAIPTTFSGSEHTAFAGYTSSGIKISSSAKEPDIVILDPEATLETPIDLLKTSGIRSIDHAVESIYSVDSTPMISSLGTEGFSRMIGCLQDLGDVNSRIQCQIGVWLSSLTLRYVRMGISHAFGYVFGPSFGIPHGITSCISLPNAVKFNYWKIKDSIKPLERRIPLYDFLDVMLKTLGIRKRLRDYADLKDALKLTGKFTEVVNSSGNPIKITEEQAKEFIEEVY